jgi:hypothetical protein
MGGNVTSGLLLIGIAATLLYAWWSGALSLILEQLTGRLGGS